MKKPLMLAAAGFILTACTAIPPTSNGASFTLTAGQVWDSYTTTQKQQVCDAGNPTRAFNRLAYRTYPNFYTSNFFTTFTVEPVSRHFCRTYARDSADRAEAAVKGRS